MEKGRLCIKRRKRPLCNRKATNYGNKTVCCADERSETNCQNRLSTRTVERIWHNGQTLNAERILSLPNGGRIESRRLVVKSLKSIYLSIIIFKFLQL